MSTEQELLAEIGRLYLEEKRETDVAYVELSKRREPLQKLRAQKEAELKELLSKEGDE